MARLTIATLAALLLFFGFLLQASDEFDNTQPGSQLDTWSNDELRLLYSLHIKNLPPLPESPGNALADDELAASLGHRIFFDTGFSRNAQVACATCHQPARNFSDGLTKGRAIGETERRTMNLLGVAFSPWFFWDGRSDSLWSQALEPLEKATEHGGTRMQYLHHIASDDSLRVPYEQLFSSLSMLEDQHRFPLTAGPFGNSAEIAAWNLMQAADRDWANNAFANIGRLLEAYQRRLIPVPAALDRYISALDKNNPVSAAEAYSSDQVAGLRLFIGKARCIHCHNGPLLTNNEFHNTGLFPANTLPVDRGRVDAVKKLLESEFNCLGDIAGSDPDDCDELRFVKTHGLELVAAFRTPSLRSMHDGPFMHTGEFATMTEVLEHYNRAAATLISDDLVPLGLDKTELNQLSLFLETVKNRPPVNEKWWSAPAGY